MENVSVVAKQPINYVRNIEVNYNGNYYNVIYGTHENGGWFSIPNWSVGGELSSFWNDTFWNTESISKCKGISKKVAKVIAESIKAAEC